MYTVALTGAAYLLAAFALLSVDAAFWICPIESRTSYCGLIVEPSGSRGESYPVLHQSTNSIPQAACKRLPWRAAQPRR